MAKWRKNCWAAIHSFEKGDCTCNLVKVPRSNLKEKYIEQAKRISELESEIIQLKNEIKFKRL